MFGIVHEEKEMPSINMSMKLQGYLLGYEVLQEGVIVQSHRYAKPVKNMVVNSGKDLMFNSTLGDSTRLFGYNSSSSGILGHCGRGSSSTPVSATDTGLLAKIGNSTSTFLTGDPNTGTRYDRENGKVIMRVTHDHEAESSDQNINELGWYGLTTVLFSRVVLPSTITVLTGQALRTIYQLEVSISPIVAASCAPSITGWTTDGDYRFECLFPATSTTFCDTDFNLFPVLNTNGSSDVLAYSYSTDSAGLYGCGYISGNLQFSGVTMYGTAQTFNTFGTAVAQPTASSTVYNALFNYGNSSGTATGTLQSYTAGNFYRDRTLVFQPNWTGYSSISIYAMRLFGLMYIFDNPQTKTNTQRLTLNYRISVS